MAAHPLFLVPQNRGVSDEGGRVCACALVCVCVLAHMRCGHVSFVRMAHVWCGHRCLRPVRVSRVLVCGACASCVADRGCLWHMSTCMYVWMSAHYMCKVGVGVWGRLCDVCMPSSVCDVCIHECVGCVCCGGYQECVCVSMVCVEWVCFLTPQGLLAAPLQAHRMPQRGRPLPLLSPWGTLRKPL